MSIDASPAVAASCDPTSFEGRFWVQESPRPGDVRTPYERDRARIIHSAGFRRLQGKTQVMGIGEGDFHRTRLTHSVECAQVGTGVLDMLDRGTGAVPKDLKHWMPGRILIEAACFSHDLGHPPFGHGGEQALFEEMREHGGFEGNAQTLRLLTRLEKYTSAGRGINPTRRMVLSILKYPIPYSGFDSAVRSKPPKCYYDDESDIVAWAVEPFSVGDRERLRELGSDGKAKHRTFDCSLMELADDIAYGIHDLEDIVARRLATTEQWKQALKSAFDSVGGRLDTEDGSIDAETVVTELFADSWHRKRLVGRLVNVFMAAAKVVEVPEFEHPLLRFRVGVRGEHEALLARLRQMAFHLAIDKAAIQQLEHRGKRVVQDVFRVLQQNPQRLIHSWDEGITSASIERRICDYVAGMTDAYAEKVYRRLFVPGVGSSRDEL